MPMKHVGIFEAKTHLSSLVDEVVAGGEIVITRHGAPVAKLVTYAPKPDPEIVAKRRQALLDARALVAKRRTRITPKQLKRWIDEGRP
jgi:prevent-host-death family protein